MILAGYCHSYLLHILIHDFYRYLADLFLSFVWALAPELLFKIYQSVERISFAGETRSVSVAVCCSSIDSHTHTRARSHHTHATTHTHTHTRSRAMCCGGCVYVVYTVI